MGKLALALQEAHAKGVVHRDLKPSNVMIKKTGQKAPVIVDFGLAHQLNAGGMRLTQTGQAMGTPYYMAFEQGKGDLAAIGPPCDIYALGVILYELLTGVVPFDGPNPMVVIAQILTTEAAPPSTHRLDLDPRLEAVCLKAMARKIDDRYPSMAALAAALTEFLKATSERAVSPAPAAPSAEPQVRTGRPGSTGSESLLRNLLKDIDTEGTTATESSRAVKTRNAGSEPAPARVPEPDDTSEEAPVPWLNIDEILSSDEGIIGASIVALLLLFLIMFLAFGIKEIVSGTTAEVAVGTAAEREPAGARVQNLASRGAVTGKPKMSPPVPNVPPAPAPKPSDYGPLRSQPVPGPVVVNRPEPPNPLAMPSPPKGVLQPDAKRPEPAPTPQPRNPDALRSSLTQFLTHLNQATFPTQPDMRVVQAEALKGGEEASRDIGTGGDLKAHLGNLRKGIDTLTKGSLGNPGNLSSLDIASRELEKAFEEFSGDHPPPEFLTTRLAGITLKLIPAGEFMMGSSEEDKDAYNREMVNGQKHRVRITRPFYLSVTEVTRGQFRAVTGQIPVQIEVLKPEKDPVFRIEYDEGSDEHPVANVTFYDAVNFCNALSRKEGFPLFYRVEGLRVEVIDWRGVGYRLPTEAEWEYSCRAGSTALYSFGDDPKTAGGFAWISRRTYHPVSGKHMKTHQVGRKLPNGFGLYDMHGNVEEWCGDYFSDSYYSNSPVVDPVGPPVNDSVGLLDSTNYRVVRGGWKPSKDWLARSAYRDFWRPNWSHDQLGFRVARSRSGAK